jgi:hypothetical protein
MLVPAARWRQMAIFQPRMSWIQLPSGMRQRMPPLSALRAFEAAARHMSFKAAAAELGVTPTAISHQVRELEEA